MTFPPLMDERHAVVEACRYLAAAGLSPGGSGNVSLRAGSTLLITPTGSSLRRVLPAELVAVDLADPRAPANGASKELPLHRVVHSRRSAAAVIHLHSPAAVAASCLAIDGASETGPLPPLTPYQVMRLGALPVAPFALPGSEELARGVETLATDHAVILLANHGSVVAAASLGAAIDLVEELEAAAHLALALAHVPHRRLSADDVAALRSR